MSIKKPVNENYCATVTEIKTLVPLENCNNVVGAIIFGNQVIVGKDTQIGDRGIFFPVECELSKEFLSNNNLYRHSELNVDKTKKGYFEDSGRVKCIKFRNHKSEGIFLPLESLSFTNHKEELTENTSFDEISGIKICKKYVVYTRNVGEKGRQGKLHKKPVSKLLDNQFRFHYDTPQLFRNVHRIKPNDTLHLSRKIHGTSSISSRILCKKKLYIFERVLKKIGVNVVDTVYDHVYASRRVVKNDQLNPVSTGFYKEDIWGIAHEELKEHLQDGMTIYFEIVGFLPSNQYIQKNYDYGCESGKHKNYIYRITYTTPSGTVFEFSAKQVMDWCRERNLNSVPFLYYGYAKDLFDIPLDGIDTEEGLTKWQEAFFLKLKETYLEKPCTICKNNVPDEGIVVRRETFSGDTFKLKSFLFLEHETKELDKGTVDIESSETIEELPE